MLKKFTSKHIWISDEIVQDETLAFGHPVTSVIEIPENIFVMDEAGDNTHGKDDGNNGGEKKVVPKLKNVHKINILAVETIIN